MGGLEQTLYAYKIFFYGKGYNMLKSNTNTLLEKLNAKNKDKWPPDHLLWKR